MVVLYLISPDFSACFLALQKHVVSIVIKRLGTFASLALSTLAPMFSSRLFIKIIQNRKLFLTHNEKRGSSIEDGLNSSSFAD